MTTLPENWVVRNDRSKVYNDKVLGYLNKYYGKNFDGFYEWHGFVDGKAQWFTDKTLNNVAHPSHVVVLSVKDFVNKTANESKTSSIKPFLATIQPPKPLKSIIGYKVKEGVSTKAAAQSLGMDQFYHDTTYGYVFHRESELQRIATTNGVLNLLFEPVYESDEIKYQLPHICGIVTEYITVRINKAGKDVRFTTKNDIFEQQEYVFTKKELIRLLEYEFKSSNGIPFRPTEFCIGCNDNFTVAASEIQKLVNLM